MVARAPSITSFSIPSTSILINRRSSMTGARATIMRFRPIIWSENVGYFSSNGQDISFLQLMADLEYECSKAQNAPNDVVCTDKHGRGHQIGVSPLAVI